MQHRQQHDASWRLWSPPPLVSLPPPSAECLGLYDWLLSLYVEPSNGRDELAGAAKGSVEVPPPDGSAFLDLTWALDGQNALWQTGLASEFAQFRERLSCLCSGAESAETACQAGVCTSPQCACGPFSPTAWPPPPSHPLESFPPQQSEPFLSRAESWSFILGTSTAATVNLFKSVGGTSHQSLFNWGTGSGVTSLGAEACSCGDRYTPACRSCNAKGGRVAGPNVPPGRSGRDTLLIRSSYARVRRLRLQKGGLALTRLGSNPSEKRGNPGLYLSEAPVPRFAPSSEDAIRSLFSDVHLWESAVEPEPHLNFLFESYGGPESAVKLLDRSVSAHPGDPSLWNDLGNAHRAMGSAGLAAECFRIGLELQPHPDLFLNLGSVVFRAGRSNEARELFEAGLRLNGRHALLMFAVASTHAVLGRLDDAAQWFERLLALHPGFAEAALQHRSIRNRRLRSSPKFLGFLLVLGAAVLLIGYAGLRIIRVSIPKRHVAVRRSPPSPTGSKKKKRL
ncbi:polypeptide N-acetylglucosaminyltransferase [Klebsormidium nitens]|uniref:Polypeptide N-acetylglucosaminyltransferase n=1 Tax=Klebsormidium nitens TaxID=105231 RepID=A0A1Y1HQL7_KLENI|nr:polypeptide N-acetylglucosaminyltransferase [Klebsormidium nitens]|eukprot:GAQ80934.1 polypeptide N-acetylglucosaminyltransferase [Klebsormidium nitens]